MSLWSARQVEWLDAMGLVPMTPATGGMPDAPAVVAPTGGAVVPAATAASAQGDERPARATPPARLHLALLRAARGDAARLASLRIDVDALRTDAAAKRALWPRLRSLRRSPR